jgi:hypothetical protein
MERIFDSPDGSPWHPQATVFGADIRFIIPTLIVSIAAYLLPKLIAPNNEKPVLVFHPIPLQIQPGWKGLILDTTDVLAQGDKVGTQIRSFDPSTGYHLGTFEADTTDSIDRKLQEATAAAEVYQHSSWTTRRKLLKSIGEWVINDQDIIVRVACRDSGKTVSFSRSQNAARPLLTHGMHLTGCRRFLWRNTHHLVESQVPH